MYKCVANITTMLEESTFDKRRYFRALSSRRRFVHRWGLKGIGLLGVVLVCYWLWSTQEPHAPFLGSSKRLKLYWINLEESHDRYASMQHQLKHAQNIHSVRVAAVNTDDVANKFRTGKIKTNGFDIVPRSQRSGSVWEMRAQRLYSYKEMACLWSHLKALESIASGDDDFAIVVEDDVRFLPHVYENIRRLVDTAPRDWDILQLYTSNVIVREHHAMLDVEWIRWLPHHWATMMYIIRKRVAGEIVNSIKHDESFVFPDRDVLVADELIYWKHKTYTYTRAAVEQVRNFGSVIQPRLLEPGPRDRIKLLPRIHMPALTSTLMVVTVLTVEDRREFDADLEQLKLEMETMQSAYQAAPHWDVIIAVRRPADIDYVQSSTKNLPATVAFHIHREPNTFSKWKYMLGCIDNMQHYDHVLVKDFDQDLVTFPWKTFVQKKGTAVLASPLREALMESMPREIIHYYKRQFFASNDAWWWRRNRKHDFIRVNAIQQPFLEMYFVLFDGDFAHWFFSNIFSRPEYIHEQSDWGPDYMWCGAAQEWDARREPCAFIPVVSFHADTRKIEMSQEQDKVPMTAEDKNAPIRAWAKNETFGRWMEYSREWRTRWGDVF